MSAAGRAARASSASSPGFLSGWKIRASRLHELGIVFDCYVCVLVYDCCMCLCVSVAYLLFFTWAGHVSPAPRRVSLVYILMLFSSKLVLLYWMCQTVIYLICYRRPSDMSRVARRLSELVLRTCRGPSGAYIYIYIYIYMFSYIYIYIYTYIYIYI